MTSGGLRVVHIITGLGQGGAEAVLLRLVSNASRDEHIVISMTDGGVYQKHLEKAGIKVHCMNMKPGSMSPTSFWRLRGKLSELKPDVVQTWMYHADFVGGMAARMAGIKAIAWCVRNSGYELQKSSRSSYILARYFYPLSRFVPRKIIYCAELARRRHEEWGYHHSKGVVIQNGYDMKRWYVDPQARSEIRQELNIPDSTPVLGLVARWNPLKDQPTLLKALAIYAKEQPNFKCLLVGNQMDNTNKDLLKLINELNLQKNVLLLGMREDVPRVMNALDLHVLSSIAEGFPNVVAEAMACEVPCVVTDVGDAALIVGDTGRVVMPSDPVAMAEAISEFLPEVLGAAGEGKRKAARERVLDNFSLDAMVNAYENVWEFVSEH